MYFIAVLPLFIFRDFTPDNELRYLSIADEALRNGNIFTFTNHGLIYADKPPLYLWIVMLGKYLFGHHSMLFLSIFSFVPTLVVVYIMDKWVGNLLTESERLAGQLMLMTSGFFIGTAIILRMDMLMCMFIVLALYTFFRIYSGQGKPRDSILFPIYVFMAIFTKGPIGLIVPLFSILVFLLLKKEIKTIGRYWGWKTLTILLALCGAWFAGVYSEGGSSYLNNLLFNQTVNRAVNSFHHKAPFYYYFIAFVYSLAPWSLLIAGVLISGIKRKLVSNDLERFFLTIGLTTFVTLSLFSSKLAVYMLPAFPFFVYLSVIWLAKLGPQKWMFILVGIPACLLCLAFPATLIFPHFVDLNGFHLSAIVIFSGVVLSASGILALKYLRGSHLNRGIITLSAGILLAVFVASFALPKNNAMLGLKILCDQAKTTAKEKGGVNYYYCEMTKGDNLDVYLGKPLEMLEIKDLYEPNKIQTPAILFTWQKAIERNDSIQVFLKGKKIHQTGSYYYVEIEH
ncbi:melittin resistance protein PqaB [Aquipluma nitroreducens]|uniref:Melittin resistance protein PqaB n=2 Tax=Aquipluma nitroreducens TaxID=2010828 RepID=A0A5K7S834_9BACT|nr:melittin resistance protein PqaB [Aquipluma nitroreducens]